MRYVFAVLALLAVVFGLAATKFEQISSLISMGHAMAKAGPPPEAVGTTVARADTWQETIDAVGSVAAARGVTVSNDAPGIVSAIHFESGKMVHEGDILVELDSNVERSQLAAVEARRELAQINAGRTRALVATESLPRSQQDSDDAVVKTSRSDLEALRAQVARKTVRAPFAGKLGIRQVNLGQYLNSGTAITSLEATETVFVDFSLPQQRLKTVSLGMPVLVVIEGETDKPPGGGVINAIDPSIDALTRSLKLRASLPNGDARLLPGMFAKVSVVLPDKRDVVVVPVQSVVHASFGDSVFIVEDRKDSEGHVMASPAGAAKVARQQFVKLGDTRGDFVSVLDGLVAGQEVVSAGAFKLHNGASVSINNAVQAKAELSPHPENR
jgi:membrane fusion protein (multidrug efflux system)